MANETSRTRTERISTERLRESVVKLIEHLDGECYFFPEGEIPEDHIAQHIERLFAWCNQPEELPVPERYQGWRNYETWLANLWQTNDNETYAHCQELTREALSQFPAVGEGTFTPREAAALQLAKLMKDECEPEDPGYCSFFGDLLNAALAEIDWYEIAVYFVDEITE